MNVVFKRILTNVWIVSFLFHQIFRQKLVHQLEQVIHMVAAKRVIQIEANAVIIVDAQGGSGSPWHSAMPCQREIQAYYFITTFPKTFYKRFYCCSYCSSCYYYCYFEAKKKCTPMLLHHLCHRLAFFDE